MGKVLVRESVLLVLCGLFSGVGIPLMLSQPPAAGPFFVGLFFGLTYIALYAMLLMLGKRMSAATRGWMAAIAWAATFLAADYAMLVRVILSGGQLAGATLAFQVVPGLFGLMLAALAAQREPAGSRLEAGLWALFMYAGPMFFVRNILVQLVTANPFLMITAVQTGAFYMFLRGALRVYSPNTVEMLSPGAGPLVKRPVVPDAIVGLLEGTLHKRARPYATLPDGTLDDGAVSVLCKPNEVEGAAAKMQEALEDKPFAVEPGATVHGWVELVVRPRR